MELNGLALYQRLSMTLNSRSNIDLNLGQTENSPTAVDLADERAQKRKGCLMDLQRILMHQELFLMSFCRSTKL